ncbi:MAG TPA: hypothetical protein VJK50_00860 [Patescibacteria group bacterium]|nr:hypothetical protein [Patescibacteria group bacterium]
MKGYLLVVRDSINNEKVQDFMEQWGGVANLNGLWIPDIHVLCIQDPDGEWSYFENTAGDFTGPSYEVEITEQFANHLMPLAAHEQNMTRAQKEMDILCLQFMFPLTK